MRVCLEAQSLRGLRSGVGHSTTELARALVEADPERFFVPPYVAHQGWLGVRLDRGLHLDELAGIVEDAYAEVAPARLVEAAARARP